MRVVQQRRAIGQLDTVGRGHCIHGDTCFRYLQRPGGVVNFARNRVTTAVGAVVTVTFRQPVLQRSGLVNTSIRGWPEAS